MILRGHSFRQFRPERVCFIPGKSVPFLFLYTVLLDHKRKEQACKDVLTSIERLTSSLTSTEAFAEISSLHTFACPFLDARWRGVQPSWNTLQQTQTNTKKNHNSAIAYHFSRNKRKTFSRHYLLVYTSDEQTKLFQPNVSHWCSQLQQKNTIAKELKAFQFAFAIDHLKVERLAFLSR